jgi:MFS family permease
LFLSGLVFQAAGLALLMVGTSLGLWIGGLIIVGLSSGIVWTSSLALAVDVVDEENLAEHMGFVGISVSCGLFLGTTLSGIVFDAAGYHAVWAMCYGLVGLDAILRLTMVEPRKTRMRSARTDEEPETPEEEAESSSDVGTPVKERQSSLPPVMLLWRSPWFVAMLLITVLDATLLTTFDGALAIHLQETFDYDTRGVGLTYISLVIPTFLAPYIGRCADRYGARIILTTTFLLGIIPLACLRFVDHDTLRQKVLVCALLALTGLFAAGRLGIYSAQIDHSVAQHAHENPDSISHEKAIAQSQGLWSAAYSIGCALGPLWGGLIQGAAGWKTETWTVALLSGVAALLAVTFADGWIARPEQQKS